MKLYEIEELHSIVKNINGILLIFSTTKNTNKSLKEYVSSLIDEFQDQNLIDEVENELDSVIDVSRQIAFLKYLLTVIDDTDQENLSAITSKKSN